MKVDVELIYADEGWLPSLYAYKFDDAWDTLRHNDVRRASRLAQVFTLTPVAA